MANHSATKKSIRKSRTRRLRNRYQGKTTRNAIREFEATEDAKVAADMFPKVVSMIDKLAKNNIIHKNKAGNLKSRLQIHLNKLA